MSDQPSLFDPPRARRSDPATSHMAALEMEDGEASRI
jgi:hypothetical protein